MCGINGAVLKKYTAHTVEDFHLILSQMNNQIIHRGPDDEGYFYNHDDNHSIGMAMRRLAIIDIESGQQPMFSEDRSVAIVYNGEIYNYLELKHKLTQQGQVFHTTSDTEVILKLYEQEGIEGVNKLDGMFAFSLYDHRIGKLFIARDFFGEKPLYYSLTEEGFYWSSELKSIMKVNKHKPVISRVGLNLYFQLTYIPAPYTIYEKIYKLDPNHLLILDCNSLTYSVNSIQQNFKEYNIGSKKDAKKVTHDLVTKSVITRSVSDVPVGTFLSGGVDSSIVTMALAKQNSARIDTFSIGFEKKSFDETEKSRTVAKLINSRHHEFIVREKDMAGRLSDIILNFDEPFADSSALASYLVSENTRKHVKVALTGDGGDEIFGGYNKYLMGMLNQKYTTIFSESIHIKLKNSLLNLLREKEDSRGIKFKLRRLLNAIDYRGDFYYNIISLGFSADEIKMILTEENYVADTLQYYKKEKNASSLTDFRKIDLQLSLEGDLNVKVDRTSMLASLECRAPFLNKELWNFSNQLPESYLIKGLDKKHILKEAFKEYFPKKFLDQPKKGFAVPVGDWLRSELRAELELYSEERFLQKQNIFNINEIKQLVNNHLMGKIDNTFRLWTFYCFQKWYKSNFH